MIDKIITHQFVDLQQLLPLTVTDVPSPALWCWARRHPENSRCPPSHACPGAFRTSKIFAAVHLDAHKRRAAEQLAYQHHILNASKKFTFSAVAEYDCTFRHSIASQLSRRWDTTNTVHYRVRCPCCVALSAQLRGSPRRRTLVNRAVSTVQPGLVSSKPLSVRSSMQHLQRLRTQRTRVSHRATSRQAFRCANSPPGRPFTWIGLRRLWPATLTAHSLTPLCMTCVTVL